jgi:hypothetical protein
MENYDLDRWKNLLSQVKLDGNPKPASIEDILVYEKELDFTLPKAFKEYYQVFGAGIYDHNSFSIEAPPTNLMPDPDRIEACKNAYEYSKEIIEILDSAHVFGIADSYVFFFFDSRTYSEEDQSYDIYGIGDGQDSIYKLTRDFFEFIRDYCIGTKAENYPDLIVGIPSEYFETGRYHDKTFYVYED